jgi:hypothetical protein
MIGRLLVSAFAFAAVLAAASAADAAPPVDTFTGTCEYDGTLTFHDPIGAVPEPNRLRWFVTGTCTGSVNGRYVVDAPAKWHASAEGLMSCTEGLEEGPGFMLIHGARIDFTFQEARVATGAKFRFAGDAGGSLEGIGSTDDDVVWATDRCLAEGGSLKRVHVFAQVSGSISG